jgi:hypothetical protein
VLALLLAYLAACYALCPDTASTLYTLVVQVRVMIKVLCLERAGAANGVGSFPAADLAHAILISLPQLAGLDSILFVFAHSHGNAVVKAALSLLQRNGPGALLEKVRVVSMGSPVYVTELPGDRCWHIHHEHDPIWELAEPPAVTPESNIPTNQLTVRGGYLPYGNSAEPLPAHSTRVYVSALRQLA